MYATDNSLPQYHDSKRARADEWDYEVDMPMDCEHVPFDLLARWNGIDSTTPILDGHQCPPMATYLAAPTMAEAVDHAVRVSDALAAIHYPR